MTHRRIGIIAMGVAALLAGCGLSGSTGESGAPGVTDKSITVGYVGPLSGPQNSYGKPSYQAFSMHIEKLNAAGGINGRKIKVVAEDDQCSPDTGVRATRNLLARDDIFMIAGFTCTGVVSAVRPILGGTDIPVIVSSAAGPDKSRDDKNLFYITGSSSRQARALLSYSKDELGASRIAVLRSSDAYGESSRATIKEFSGELGLDLVADEVSAPDTTSVSAQVNRIVKARPDVVILGTYSNIAALYLDEARKRGFDVPALGMAATDPAVELVQDEKALANFRSLIAYGDVPTGSKLKPYVEEFIGKHSEYKNQPIPVWAFLGLTEASVVEESLKRVDGDLTQAALIEALTELKDWTPKAPTLACPLDFTRDLNEGETCYTLYSVQPGRQRTVIGPVDGK